MFQNLELRPLKGGTRPPGGFFNNEIDLGGGATLTLVAEVESFDGNRRIVFRFDRGFFTLTRQPLTGAPLDPPLELPYPVPFKVCARFSSYEAHMLLQPFAGPLSRSRNLGPKKRAAAGQEGVRVAGDDLRLRESEDKQGEPRVDLRAGEGNLTKLTRNCVRFWLKRKRAATPSRDNT